jgi:hypothetical protein
MSKFLLSALAVALLTGPVRAEGVAGEVPFTPEPTIVSKAVETVTRAFLQAKGVVLASRVRPGMSPEQVGAILGDACLSVADFSCRSDIHLEVGVTVNFSRRASAGGGPEYCVTAVRIWSLVR